MHRTSQISCHNSSLFFASLHVSCVRTRLSELSCCGPDLHVIPTNLPSWDHNFVYWWCSVIATCRPAPEGPEQLIPKVCKGPNRTSERRKNRWVIRNHIMHRNKLWWRPLLSISEFSNGSWPPIVLPEWNYLAIANFPMYHHWNSPSSLMSCFQKKKEPLTRFEGLFCLACASWVCLLSSTIMTHTGLLVSTTIEGEVRYFSAEG